MSNNPLVKYFNDIEFKELTRENISLVKGYFDIYFETHKYGCCDMSFLDAFTQSRTYFAIDNDDNFIWLDVRAFTKKANGSLTLYIPPIRKDRDHKKEKELMYFMAANGVYVNVSDEDFSLYDVSKSDILRAIPAFDNYIASSEMLIDLAGKEFKNLRHYRNQYRNFVSDNTMVCNVDIDEEITKYQHKHFYNLINSWKKNLEERKGDFYRIYGDLNPYIDNYNKYFNENIQLLSLFFKGDLCGFGLSEKIHEKNINSSIGYKNYDHDIRLNEMMNLEEIRQWYERLGHHFNINLGYCGTFTGLKHHKQKYRPIKTLRQYRLNSQTDFVSSFDKVTQFAKIKMKRANNSGVKNGTRVKRQSVFSI